MTRLGFIESRSLNRVNSPRELYADIGRALAGRHTDASLSYEHRYVDVQYPTRQCPACGSVERLQVVINTDVGVRTRCCPACDAAVRDAGVDSERLPLVLRRRRRLRA